MTAHHTKAPWTVRIAKEDEEYEIVAYSDHHDEPPCNIAQCFGGMEDGVAEQNAYLIAAAPDGLKCAEYIYALLLQRNDQWRIENQKAYCMLRDFIAKATAEEPENVQNDFEDAVAGVKNETAMQM